MIPRTPDGVPALRRPVDDRLLAGVASGLAGHLGVSVGVVRAVFVALSLFAGAGVVAYALLWVFVPQAADGVAEPGGSVSPATVTGEAESGEDLAHYRGPNSAERRQAIGIAVIGVAIAIATWAVGLGAWVGAVVGPMAIVAVGAAFIWREADQTRRDRWRRTAAGLARTGRGTWVRLLGGIALVVGGLTVFGVGQLDIATARSAAIAAVLTLVGVAVIAVPWLARLIRELTAERKQRERERERAEIAAHLHDSVLQTLALIQRQPDDPREVQRLARRQERELRTWLYGPTGFAHGLPRPGADPDDGADPAGTAMVELRRVAAEVEDTYAIAAEPVTVGDTALTPQTTAVVAAAREAIVNAAKHSGEQQVSIYAEVSTDRISVYVRDRGRGFDPRAIDGDRHGIAQSIKGRMRRFGGTAEIRSAPGQGCEVVLTMPLDASLPSDSPADHRDQRP